MDSAGQVSVVSDVTVFALEVFRLRRNYWCFVRFCDINDREKFFSDLFKISSYLFSRSLIRNLQECLPFTEISVGNRKCWSVHFIQGVCSMQVPIQVLCHDNKNITTPFLAQFGGYSFRKRKISFFLRALDPLVGSNNSLLIKRL